MGPEGWSQEPEAAGKVPHEGRAFAGREVKGLSLDSCFIILPHTDLFRCSQTFGRFLKEKGVVLEEEQSQAEESW